LTMPGRESMARRALDCYARQTYEPRELVIDDGPGCVGLKRNRANARAKGTIVAHWDDDDWSAPERLEDQVARLIESGADATGYREMYFRDEVRGCWWIYRASRLRTPWVLGTSLVYWRKSWAACKFPAFQIGEDNVFCAKRKVAEAAAGRMMWASIHPGNTSAKNTGNNYNWRRVEAPEWFTAS
jgi:glycosyltransferase involved in cell wall biosynthesis